MPIIFDCCGKVEEAQKNIYPKVGKDVCGAHVEQVWNKVSEFVERMFNSGRGVRIPGFVTFNYKILTREFNQKKVIVERVPFMLLNEDLVKMYDLKASRPTFIFDVRGENLIPFTKVYLLKCIFDILQITEVPLNLSQITCETGLPRACVEACIEEVIHVSRSISLQSTFNYDESSSIFFRYPGLQTCLGHGQSC